MVPVGSFLTALFNLLNTTFTCDIYKHLINVCLPHQTPSVVQFLEAIISTIMC